MNALMLGNGLVGGGPLLNLLASSYRAELAARGKTADPADIRRMSRAMNLLRANGLDDFTDGLILYDALQVGSGAPVTILGNDPAIFSGTFTRADDGWTADQSDTQGICLTIPDTRVGTVVCDVTPSGTSGVDNGGFIWHLSGSANPQDAHGWSWAGSSQPQLTTLVAGSVTTQTSLLAPGVISRGHPRESRLRRIHAVTFGDTDVQVDIDGIESGPTPNKTAAAAASVPQVYFSIFRRPATSSTFDTLTPAKMRAGAYFIYGRKLTLAERRIVGRAIEILSPRRYRLVIEGDSIQEEVYNLTRTLDNWGYRLTLLPGTDWADWRNVNIATSGMANNTLDTTPYFGWANQAEFWQGYDQDTERTLFAIGVGDINGIGNEDGLTTAQRYDFILAYAEKAMAAGMEVVLMTSPIPQAPTWNSTLQTALKDLNQYARDNWEADGFLCLVDAEYAVDMTDSANREDDVHANGTGNALWAEEFDAVVNERAPINPLTLSPYVWIDASDAATLLNGSGTAAADGEAIATWQDKSGNARHLTQGTAASRPVRVAASNLVNFDGANDALAVTGLTLALPYTIIAVVRQDSWTLNDTLFQCSTVANNGKIRQAATTPSLESVNNNASTGATTPDLAVGELGIVSMVFSATTDAALMRVSGMTPGRGTCAAGDGNALILGAADTGGVFVPADMHAAEVLVFTGTLSESNQNAVRRYLRAKWNTP